MSARVHVETITANIFDVHSEVFVNPWNRNIFPRLAFKQSRLSGELQRRTTPGPWKKLASYGMLHPGTVVHTSAGELPGFDMIFHAVGLALNWKSTPEIVITCAQSIVHAAHKHNVTTIAVPLIGAGHGGLAPDQSEQALRAGFHTTPSTRELMITIVHPTTERR